VLLWFVGSDDGKKVAVGEFDGSIDLDGEFDGTNDGSFEVVG